MYYKTDVNEFAKAVAELCTKRSSTSIVFLSNTGSWGKLFLREGEVCSLRYSASKGLVALAELADLTSLQYQFCNETKEVNSPEDCKLSNRLFFRALKAEDVWDATLKLLSEPTTEQVDEKIKIASSIKTSTKGFRRKKILIADESRVARKVVAKVLIKAGFSVVEAENGFDALGQLQNESPDLILLDLMMPEIDGFKLATYLKKNKNFKNIPLFILISRDSLLDNSRDQKMIECDEYLTKPLNSPLLLEKINEYLRF